jgi:GTP-binding protein YchF
MAHNLYLPKIGIVGLANVGKSLLFNILVQEKLALSKDYPFCTIKPNFGTFNFFDDRLTNLAKIINYKTIIPVQFKVIDIAGLVKHASIGKGLGNQFLSKIREVDLILYVLGCFRKESNERIEKNIGILLNEIIQKDIEIFSNSLSKNKKINRNQKNRILTIIVDALKEFNIEKIKELLLEDKSLYKYFFKNLIILKPSIFLFNISKSYSDPKKIKKFLENRNKIPINSINKIGKVIKKKSLFIDLKKEWKNLKNRKKNISKKNNNLGWGSLDLISILKSKKSKKFSYFPINSTKINFLIKKIIKNLKIGIFFTFNQKLIQSWKFKLGMNALQCSSIIHSSFKKRFIRVQIFRNNYFKKMLEDFEKYNIIFNENQKNLFFIKGKKYRIKDGEIIFFKLSKN